MQRLGIGVGIDRNGADAHGPRGADDPAGNFAAIGDEEGFYHLLAAFIAARACSRETTGV